MKFEFKITRDDQGKRFDYACADLLGKCSRNYASGMIKTGNIVVSGEIKKPGYRLKPGDIISGLIPEEHENPILPESLPVDIIHEDSHILVVNKKAGMVVHPAPGNFSGTLVNALLYHLPDLKKVGEDRRLRPGIVHRLDKDTTGIMVVAKNNSAFHFLKKEFMERRVAKKYLGLATGNIKEDTGRIILPIGRDKIKRKRMSTTAFPARHAETLWRVRKRFDIATFVEAELKTGRTHQIRVHFRALGHPLIGDRIYGFRKRGAKKKDQLSILERTVSRQMLHAWKLSFRHPFSGRRLYFKASVPHDMKQVLLRLSMA